MEILNLSGLSVSCFISSFFGSVGSLIIGCTWLSSLLVDTLLDLDWLLTDLFIKVLLIEFWDCLVFSTWTVVRGICLSNGMFFCGGMFCGILSFYFAPDADIVSCAKEIVGIVCCWKLGDLIKWVLLVLLGTLDESVMSVLMVSSFMKERLFD